ncbi:hypothetical protein MKW94_022519 [Papaver nudicaule]|uniref:Uncharacterized protein n=1 Tax=Papaver nudicaule TaxID=74823 RepID=A0AA41UY34_PAPNU|nr:hypothetical protein [Papaver nudicaule]
MASKIHLFRKSAMEAGTPGKYYINPSEKLMSKAPDWTAVEHEDYIETRTNRAAFNKDIIVFMKRYCNQAVDDCENKDDEFSYILNMDFLNVMEMKAEMKDGITKLYYPKIKGEENKKKRKNVAGVHQAAEFQGGCFGF